MAIKLGVVGLSNNGGAWASLALIPPLFTPPLKDQYRLTALSTRSPESAKASAEHFSTLAGGEVKAYSGATDAIAADSDLDLIAISVKAPDHLAAVLPAIETGKAVFIEWPAGKNLAETCEIAEKAKTKGVRSIVGLQGWQTPVIKKIREVIASGEIGKVTSCTWVATKLSAVPYWSPFTATPYEYTLDPKQGGGLADIWIGHNLSMITRALGPLESVTASATTSLSEIIVGSAPDDTSAKRVPARAPDQYAVGGVLAGGALFSGTWRALASGPHGGPALFFVIDGSAGQIRVQSDNPGAGFPQVFPPDELWVNGEKIELEAENKEMPPTARAWVEFAKGKEGEYPSLEDAVLLRRQVEAIKQAVETGKKVVVSEV